MAKAPLDSNTKKRPLVLFTTPSGWANRRHEPELAAERLASVRASIAAAGWNGEPFTDKDDAIELARNLKPRLLVVPTHAHAGGIAKKANALDPAPKVLVAIEEHDRKNGLASIEYTGSVGWLPYFDAARLAEALTSWRDGEPTPAERARLDELLPPRVAPTARQKKAKRAGDTFDAKLDAMDSAPLAGLDRQPRDLVLSLHRRLMKLRDANGAKAPATWPAPIRAHWLVCQLDACILHAGNGFPRFFELGDADIRETKAALLEMGAKPQAKLLDEALTSRDRPSALRALEKRWRTSNSNWPDASPFQQKHAVANVAKLDRALALIALPV